jgi:hypothetical protein
MCLTRLYTCTRVSYFPSFIAESLTSFKALDHRIKWCVMMTRNLLHLIADLYRRLKARACIGLWVCWLTRDVPRKGGCREKASAKTWANRSGLSLRVAPEAGGGTGRAEGGEVLSQPVWMCGLVEMRPKPFEIKFRRRLLSSMPPWTDEPF